jgi:1-deoxy-D-xylulose-5-phosphate synthase
MAGGLAKQGMTPVVALYSTFLQRSYDQILQDVAMLKLPVVLAVDRAGLVGEDGETHHGIFDVGFLRQAPGMTVLCPASCKELEDMLTWAVDQKDGPVAIRYPRGGDRGYSESGWNGIASAVCHRSGTDATILTYGTMLENVLSAAEILSAQGVNVTVLRLMKIDPLCAEQLLPLITGDLLIVEEAAAGAGIGEALAWELRKLAPELRIDGMDLGCRFITHGSLPELYRHYGLDPESIAKRLMEVRQNES